MYHFDINNPLHYIAANKPEETIKTLQFYGFSYPQTQAELIQAIDLGVHEHGEAFVKALTQNHPDMLPILRYSNIINADYATSFSNAKPETLKIEIESLKSQLVAAQDDKDKTSEISEKIDFINRLLIERSSVSQPPVALTPGAGPTDPSTSIHKTNQYILIAIAVVLLMFFGSKILKHD